MIMRGEVRKGKEINCYCPVCQPVGEGRDKRLYYCYDDGKLLAKCFHGCDFDEIVKYFPKNEGGVKVNAEWTVLREHVYYTENGGIFGKKVYFLVDGKKRPSWYRYENGEYKTGLNGQKAGLYKIIELLKNMDDTVFIVEGEKDADTLIKHGLLAVSPPNGAGYWPAAFNQYFKKRAAVVIPDNDEQGRSHAGKVVKNLVKSAKSVRMVDLTNIVPELKSGGDVSDVFDELSDAKNLLLQLVAETETEQTRSRRICFDLNDEGKPLKTFDNFKLLLNHYEIGIRHNSISGIEFSGSLPKMTDENMENVTLGYLYSISRECGINFSDSELGKYILMESDFNSYNPVRDWLEGLDRNRKGYIRKYFDCLIFDESEEQNKDMYLTLFGKWLMQCIAMQYNELKNPAGADGALGLQSRNEGIGKTRFFVTLCFDPKYFKDSVSLDPSNTDSVRRATGFWISELGEVESTLSKDLARLKAFITEAFDTYRIPFARALSNRSRKTSFCFTCNSDRFLKDGDNRRFWTIPIAGVDLKTLASVDINGVWGEAYRKYLKEPQGYRLSPDELAWLKENNREKFGFRINEEEVLRDKLNFDTPDSGWSHMTATDVSDFLFGDKRQARIIGKILCESLGYLPKKNGTKKHFRIVHGQKEYYVPLKKWSSITQ